MLRILTLCLALLVAGTVVTATQPICSVGMYGHCWRVSDDCTEFNPIPPSCHGYVAASIYQNEWNYLMQIVPADGFNPRLWFGGYAQTTVGNSQQGGGNIISGMWLDGTSIDWEPAGGLFTSASDNFPYDRPGQLTERSWDWQGYSEPGPWFYTLCKGPNTLIALIVTYDINNGAFTPGDAFVADRLAVWGYSIIYQNITTVNGNLFPAYDLIVITGERNTGTNSTLFMAATPPIINLSPLKDPAKNIGLANRGQSPVTVTTFEFPNKSQFGGFLPAYGDSADQDIALQMLPISSDSSQHLKIVATDDSSLNNAVFVIAEKGTTASSNSYLRSSRRISLPTRGLSTPGLNETVYARLVEYAIVYAAPKLRLTLPDEIFYGDSTKIKVEALDGNGVPAPQLPRGMYRLRISRSGGAVLPASGYTALSSTGSTPATSSQCHPPTTTFPNLSYPADEKWYYVDVNSDGFLKVNISKLGSMFFEVDVDMCQAPYPLSGSTTGVVDISDIGRTVQWIASPTPVVTIPTHVRASFRIVDAFGNSAFGTQMTVVDYTIPYGTVSQNWTMTTNATNVIDLLVGYVGNSTFRIQYGASNTYLTPMSNVFEVYMGPPAQVYFDPTPVPIDDAHGLMSEFTVRATDAGGNNFDGSFNLTTRSLGILPSPEFYTDQQTLMPFTLGVTLDSDTTKLNDGGCFVLKSYVNVEKFPPLSVESGLILMKMPALFHGDRDPVDENEIIQPICVEYWQPYWVSTVTENTCQGTITLVDDYIQIPPQDYEILPDGQCYFTFVFNECPAVWRYEIAIADVPDAPTALDQFLPITVRSPVAMIIGNVIFDASTVDSANDDPTYTIYTVPQRVRVYPCSDPTATTAAGLRAAALTDADMKYTVENQTLTFVAPRGTYTDSFIYSVRDSLGRSNNATIYLNVSVPCDAATQTPTADGFCACSAAAYIDLNGDCQQCLPGTYYSGNSQDPQPCLPCPANGQCDGGISPPQALQGYYCDPTAKEVPQTYPRCIPQSACPAVGCGCAQGSTGNLCSACAKNYYKDDSVCKPCPQTSLVFLLLLALLMIIVCFALIKVARRSTAYFTSLSVGFNFLQIVSILGDFRLQWPDFVLTVLNSLNFLNFNINVVQPECAFAGGDVPYFTIWIFKLVLPLLFLVIFVLTNVVARLYSFCRNQVNEIRHPRMAKLYSISDADLVLLRNASINGFFTILVLLYLNLISTALEIFACDSDQRMIKDASYQCYGGEWKKLMTISIIFSILYGLGIPVLFYAVLRSNRRSLLKELTIVKFGLLYRRYKHELFMWEIAILWRKLAIILGLLFFSSNPIGAASFAVASLLVALVLQVFFQPYVAKRVNFLETMHLTCGSIVLVCGLILASVSNSPSMKDSATVTGIGVAVLVIIGINCLVLGYIIFQELRYQLRLVRHGVQGGFASDEVLVDDFFFKSDFYVRDMSRNALGCTSTVLLTSAKECKLRVEYVDKRKNLLDGKRREAALHNWVQSDGRVHQIVTAFHQPGRYGMRVYAWNVTDPEPTIVFAREADGSGSRGTRCRDWLQSAYRRNTGGTVATFAFNLNVDSRPRTQLSFPRLTPICAARGLVVQHPNFFELTPHARTTFTLRGGPIHAVLSPRRPLNVNETHLIPLKQDGDRILKTSTTFGKSGAIHLWCQFQLPTRDISLDAPTGAAAALWTPDFAMGSFSSTNSKNSGSAIVGRPAPPPPTDSTPFEADDDATKVAAMASQGKFVRCASFEVLEQHAGWTDSGDVESELIGLLVKDTSDRASIDLDNLNPVFDETPLLSSLFTARRGILYAPRRRKVTCGVTCAFEVIIPGAMVYVLSDHMPSFDTDGTVLFKRDDGVYSTRASFSTPGPLHLWVKIMAGSGLGGFENVVSFEVVAESQ